ncbi:MAG: hypothetical protein J6B29_06400 [Clostridia bacterium]|nr:hypothetical protein [Clostridia bacterium]
MENNQEKIEKTGEEINESNAAKRMRLLGIENDDNIHNEEMAIKKGSFFQNLWYQYKWGIIIGAILLAIAIIFIVQMANKPRYDMYLSYTGPMNVDIEIRDALEYSFVELMQDYNEDGEKTLNFASIIFQNEEQRKGDPNEVYKKYGALMDDYGNSEALQNFHNQRLSGIVVMYLMDQTLYEEYAASFMKIEDVLGYRPDSSVMAGDNAIYLKKTEFYKHMINTEGGYALRNLPGDTVICIMPKLTTVDEDLHRDSIKLLEAIVSFKEQ